MRLGAFAVAGITTVSACGGGGDALQIYSGRHYGSEVAFERFEEETGIDVEFLVGNDAELRERIAAEGEETEADVYITVDAGNLAAAAEQGLFQPISSTVLDEAIPAELRDPDGLWYGFTIRARTIMYNTERISVDEVPTTYEELAEPEWAGRVCMRVSTNVYQQSLVASLIATHGETEALRIVEGWAANAEIIGNDILLIESIAEGVCDIGVANHYYLGRKLEEDRNYPVDLIWANQDDRGVHVNTSGGGVTRYSSKPAEAQQLLEWLATDGQNVLVDASHEYPANPSTTPAALITEEFGTDFVRDTLNASVFGSLNADAVRLMDEAGYD